MSGPSIQTLRNLATDCIPGILVVFGIGAVEKAFVNQIRVQKCVLSTLRESLKDRQNWQSYIEHKYCWICESLLSIPVINVVICAVLSIFGSPLDRLWTEKKFEPLVAILEQQLKEPQGITWEPPIRAQPRDNTFPTLSRYCRNLAFCAEQGELISSPVCNRYLTLTFQTGVVKERGGKIIWMPDPTGALEGTIAEQIVQDGKKPNPIFRGKIVFVLDWEKLPQEQDCLQIVDQILLETKAQKEKVLLLISNPSLFPKAAIEKIKAALDSTFCVFAIETKVLEKSVAHSEKILYSEILIMMQEMQSIILHDFLPSLESQYHLYIEDDVVKKKFTSKNDLKKTYPSQIWIAQIEELIKNYTFTPNADDKKLSKFLNILIRIRNRVSNKAPWDQKIEHTARKFSSVLKCSPQEEKRSSKQKLGEHKRALNTYQATPNIDINSDLVFIPAFCTDLTSEENLFPFIGREKEILQIAEILGLEHKSSPLLLGEPGVGKMAIVQGIAQQIIKNSTTLPSIFQGKKIFLLKDTDFFADCAKGTMSAADILIGILQEAEHNKGQFLFIFENLEGFLGSNNKENVKMRNLLLSALGNKSIDCIATTTPADYSHMVQKDQGLEQQFSPVKINQPSDKELTEILSVAIPWLGIRHAVNFDDKMGNECIKLARKYLKNASFPAIIIDILDQTASQYKITHPPKEEDRALSLKLKSQVYDPKTPSKFSQTIRADLLYPVFCQKTGLPLGIMNQSDKELLRSLDEKISARIKGQPEAIKSLCDGVRISRFEAGNGRSMAVFLFLGTTGVGKTETVKVLAELLYGSSDKILRLDMAEYSTDIDKTKLIGVAPGYVGHDQGGILTNWLKNNPFSIVLFDEMEKSHKQIRQMLLGLFDAGRITDSKQNTIECPDAIFIMTSNLGADKIMGNQNDPIKLKNEIEPILRQEFSPEFLGRVRTTTIFRSLDKENVRQITELRLKEIKDVFTTDPRYLGIDVSWEPKVVNFFAEDHYDDKKGGRGIEIALRDNIKNPLINGVINEKIRKGNKVVFEVKNDKINMKIT